MSEIERAIGYPALKAERLTRSDIIQGNINMLDSGARECRRIGELASAEEKEIIAEILRAELDRENNEPLTIEEIIDMNGKPVWCQTGDGYEGWALVIVDNYQDGGHYLYLFSDDLTSDGINEAFEPDEDFYNLTFSDDPNGHFGLHALGWRAYRYEPKGEPNV